VIDVVTLITRIELIPAEIGRLEEESIYLRKDLDIVSGDFNILVSKERMKEQRIDPKATVTTLNDRIVERCEPDRLKVLENRVRLELKAKEMNQKEREFQGAKVILKYKETELRNLGGV